MFRLIYNNEFCTDLEWKSSLSVNMHRGQDKYKTITWYCFWFFLFVPLVSWLLWVLSVCVLGMKTFVCVCVPTEISVISETVLELHNNCWGNLQQNSASSMQKLNQRSRQIALRTYPNSPQMCWCLVWCECTVWRHAMSWGVWPAWSLRHRVSEWSGSCDALSLASGPRRMCCA